jgi:cysteinyl-tRNA synthetase
LDSSASSEDLKSRLLQDRSDLLDCGRALGLFQEVPSRFLQEIASAPSEMSTAEIENLVRARDEARKRKDWTTADSIREDLWKQGIVLEDAPDGTTWRLKLEVIE